MVPLLFFYMAHRIIYYKSSAMCILIKEHIAFFLHKPLMGTVCHGATKTSSYHCPLGFSGPKVALRPASEQGHLDKLSLHVLSCPPLSCSVVCSPSIKAVRVPEHGLKRSTDTWWSYFPRHTLKTIDSPCLVAF